VRAALDEGRERLARAGVEEPAREAEILLAAALRVPRIALHSGPPEIDAAALARWRGFLDRRERREPAAYLLGSCEFRSRDFRVTPDVLVPRPETEHLVEAALEALPAGEGLAVADVGTGSGCIAISLAAERPLLRVLAVDRSAAALEVARANARTHGVAERVRLLRGDLLEAVRGPLDLVACNPPYVSTGDTVDPEVRFEPAEAVFAGPDGLEAYRRLAPGAARVLRPGGLLLVETPGDRADEIAAILRTAGLRPRPPIPDLAGRPRVIAASRP
jgi:release factor glutamine methyltransferase